MGQYVARKRARFYSGGRQVNIPWGAVLDEQDGSLYWQGRPLCRISSQKAREWAVSVGLFAGNGTLDNGEPNMMWEDFLTREQAAQLFYRFAQQHGLV